MDIKTMGKVTDTTTLSELWAKLTTHPRPWRATDCNILDADNNVVADMLEYSGDLAAWRADSRALVDGINYKNQICIINGKYQESTQL